MRNKVTLYIKTMRLVDSCQKREQLIVANEYIKLAVPKMNRVEMQCVYELLKKKIHEILL